MKSKASQYRQSSTYHLFGKGTVGTSFTPVNAGGALNLLLAADAIRVKVGGNAEDDADAGDGARSVMVKGLDANLEMIEELIETAGADASASTTLEFFRVYEAYVVESGTSGAANTGDIEIETEAGTSLLVIAAGEGRSTQANFTIPAGKRGLLWYAKVSPAPSSTMSARLMAAADASIVAAPFPAPNLIYQTTTLERNEWTLREPVIFEAETDLYWEALISADTGEIGIDWELELIESIS